MAIDPASLTAYLIAFNLLLTMLKDVWNSIEQVQKNQEIPTWEEIISGQVDLGKLIDDMIKRSNEASETS